MRFTADEAFELQGTEDAIMINWLTAKTMILSHHANPTEFWEECVSSDIRLSEFSIDAAEVLGWLGY